MVEAEYSSPYLSHATMEPMTGTAWFKQDGMLHVWTSTQNGEASIAAAAEAAGLPLEQVEVHKMIAGGGFGRRGAPQDYVRQSVAIAKQFPGKPVKLMWSREEDMQHGFYRRLAGAHEGRARRSATWSRCTQIACPSILALLVPEAIRDGIDFTAVRTFSDARTNSEPAVDYAMRNPHVPVGFWRAPGFRIRTTANASSTSRARRGKDPGVPARELKPGDKNRLVLEAVARPRSGLAAARGVHRGSHGRRASAATPRWCRSLGEDGRIKVHRVIFAIDSATS